MKNILFKNWNWIRILRLIFAIYIAIKAFQTNQTIYFIIATFLLYQVIFNIKCLSGNCIDNKCDISAKNNK